MVEACSAPDNRRMKLMERVAPPLARWRISRGRLSLGERRLIDRFLRPGMRVLDLGCGDGRVTRPLAEGGVDVVGLDIRQDVLLALRVGTGDGLPIGMLRADACAVPFPDRSFDAVIFAFNGLDEIPQESGRLKALAECARVLRPGGYLMFSSHNPLGALFSPWGFAGLELVRQRARYLFGRRYRLQYLPHPNGRRFYQARPGTVIAEAERTGLSLVLMMSNRLGLLRPRSLVRLCSEWPYYVFAKRR